MVAVLPSLLSDQPPEVPLKAGCGDRFHYFRGLSGRRYLFSAIDIDDLANFRSVVVAVARKAAGGRLAAEWMGILDSLGRPIGERRVPVSAPDSLVLVHCLTISEAGRFDVVADLSSPPLSEAA